MSTASPHIGRWFGLIVGVAILLLSAHALLSAISSALDSGTILVNSYVRGRPRQLVPWSHAWAYLLGLLLLASAGLSVAVAAVGRSAFALLALGLFPVGLALTLFSAYLSTLRDSAFLFCFFAVTASVFVVNKHLGKVAAVVYWSAAVGLFLFAYA